MSTISAEDINALLPQTQCGECGYPGCLPYAQALAKGMAPIDRCPPGGVQTLMALGEKLNIDPTPYRLETEKRTRPPSLAIIDEAECIGCTKCIQACPVDAIIGGAKWMHHVLQHECTGCGLCVIPCPVDCIDMIPQKEANYNKETARKRFYAKQIRLIRREDERQKAHRGKQQLAAHSTSKQQDRQNKKDYILQALSRSQAKRTPSE